MSLKQWSGVYRTCFVIGILFAAQPGLLWGDVTGTILGDVRDSSGGAVAGAHITAVNTQTGFKEEAIADAVGEYRLQSLPIGTYRVEAQMPGFQTFVAEGVVLTVDEQHRVDVRLQVGSVQEQVQVEGVAVQVETSSTQMGTVIGDKQMLDLPLNGRSYIDLLSVQAGVAPESANTTGLISVNGQREAGNAFLVNGGDVSEGRNFGTSVIPNLDSVAEFRLVTNSADAEYGRFSGAVMNAITKSGTNGFHGAAFEFLRNSDMDARGFFDQTRAVLKRNQFGYAVGGPAIKNKLFWFTDYQGTRQSQGAAGTLSQVPTAAERAGQFSPSELSGTVVGSYWASVLTQRLGYIVTNNEPYSQVFPGGLIPASAMSPIGVNLLNKYVPLPNAGGDNYLTPPVVTLSPDDRAGQRVDFINKKTGNWYFYYLFDQSNTIAPGTYGPQYGNFGTVAPKRVQQGTMSNTKTIGTSAVNDFRLSFLRSASLSGQPTDPEVTLSSLGFVTGVNTLGIVNSGPDSWQSVPPMTLSGVENFSFGRSGGNLKQANNNYRVDEGFSKIHDTHTLKFGGSFGYYQVNERRVELPNGSFTFDGSETGDDVADFLLGAPESYTQASLQVLDSRTKYGAIYAQDSWRITSNFTLNYGVRWEVSQPWYDTQNKIETIVPGVQSTVFPGAPQGWLVPGDPGLPGGGAIPSTLAPTDYHLFAPRLGLAWSPRVDSGLFGKLFGGPGKTSIRAASGIFYTAIQDAGLFDIVADAPYGLYWVSPNPVLLDQPFLQRADGSSQGQRFPFILPVPGSAAIKNVNWAQLLPISSSPGYAVTNKLPYAEHFNFSLQRQLSGNTLVTLAYVGTEGHKLFAMYDANPGNAALCLSLRGAGVKTGTTQCGPNLENTVFTLPNGNLVEGTRSPLGINFGSGDTYESTNANSDFNSLQATVERRAKNMTVLVAYTFSKSLDDASSFTTMNFSDFHLSRALSSFDSTHNFVASYTYALPIDRGLSFLPKRLTQGWNLSGITRFATGFPIALSETGDRALTGTSGADHPNFIGPLVITPDVRDTSNHQYFNSSAFTMEALGTMGNADPRFFHGPGINNWDVGLQKTTHIHESMSLLFRAEFFNAMEHAQFSAPTGSFTSKQFGDVTSVQTGSRGSGGRIGQMSLKFLW
jgi:hypothetical protein